MEKQLRIPVIRCIAILVLTVFLPVIFGRLVPIGGDCSEDIECFAKQCQVCESCTTIFDCTEDRCCINGFCSGDVALTADEGNTCGLDCHCFVNNCNSANTCDSCSENAECEENKCCENGRCSVLDEGSAALGDRCIINCECESEMCTDSVCALSPLCPPGSDICNDPHVKGLRGQRMDVTGVDGEWYCLVKDPDIDLQVNVRFTAPLPVEFPHRQLITGIALLSKEHSLVIEAKTPYDTSTNGCPGNISPCLVDGGLRITIDEEVVDHFLHPNRDTTVFDDVTLSASNLPVECRQFGGENIWARMYEEMLYGQRQLRAGSFEDWVLRFDTMAAHDWCKKYITERGLDHVQSNHGVFKITTPTVVIRLNVGVNHQGEGEYDWDGRTLPDLDFWQMDVGFEGLAVDHVEITGILGETARPVLDDEGREVMSGDKALRGTVEDYRVSGPLGTNFSLLQQKMHYQM